MSTAFRLTAPLRLESHAHREAKALMVKWLREAAANVGWDEYARFSAITWRVNRPGPHWGIWAEYPILWNDGVQFGEDGLTTVWDEVCGDGRAYLEDEFPAESSYPWRSEPPTYDQLAERGTPPYCVLDVAVQHKGQIAYGIEIVHKHRCGKAKLAFLRGRIVLIEIPAYWVLGQVDRPSEIPAEFFL